MMGIAARIRRSLYRSGVLPSERLPRPVLSIGNLSVGGTGKTPHVLHLAGWLTARGHRVAILSRGYGRTTKGVLWVSDGERVLPTPAESGDEPYLLASRLNGVPVLVGESRAAAGRACLERIDVDLFLLDDGFQHLSLHRDLDLLLVDSGRRMGNRLTLPFGPLREPPSHARFADILVVTKCETPEEGRRITRDVPFPAGKPVGITRLRPLALVGRDGRETPLDPPGTAIAAFSALARNEQFAETLREAGYDIRRFSGFRDHHRFTAGDLREIRESSGGLPLVTTEKDLVRLPPDLPFEVRALAVGVEWLAGWEEISATIEKTIGKRP